MSTFPEWKGFTPEKAATELTVALAEAEKSVAAIEARKDIDYAGLVWGLTDGTRHLWDTWTMTANMLSVMNSEAWRKLEDEYRPKIVAFSLRVGQSRPVYDAAKRLAVSEKNPLRKRILTKLAEGGELSGVGLDGEKKTRFNDNQARQSKLGSDFANAVIDATAAFKLEKGGKTYTIDDANYPETMKHCADREVREKLMRARAGRAPENAARITEMLKLRAEEAELLGFADFAALSLSRKCAHDAKAVMKMIDDLDVATAAPAAREEAELGKDLAPWDRAYAAERLRERKYAYSEAELKRHFEAQDVLKGLWRMTHFLFGVEIEEVTGAAKSSVWHPDVRFFRVKENGAEIAHFYVDPYVRNGLKRGGAWMNDFRNRCDRLGRKPLAVLVLNWPQPDEKGKCYLPMREVETVFHEFGHSLQCMLTRVIEEDAAGLGLIEWDAVEVASQFMENWCLDDRTGIVVPAELKAKVRAAKNFRAATACRRQLAFAKTDLQLHCGKPVTDADTVKRANFAHFGLATVEEDRFLCAFTHIFAGGYAAGYYGYKWAEVMSADCFGAFEEAGLKDEAAVKRTGQRYRDTILALGGSEDALSVFRRFRGRNPEITSLLRQQGLK